MYVNITNVGPNCTLEDESSVNRSDVTLPDAVCAYREYAKKEKEQLEAYTMVGYVLGTLIIMSNIIVVISSGLILRKGQQSKSTYLILGNVSLADTIVGFSLIFGLAFENPTSNNTLCIMQMGLLVCPAMVSIFSVGLIAVDRYLYILHGLYYQRWFSSTRVRIGILCVWMFSLILGFLPATGWINEELSSIRCLYIALFPGGAILLNSLLSIIPIAMVGVLYTIILAKALKTVDNINASKQSIDNNALPKPKLRMYRGTVTYKKQDSSHSLEPLPRAPIHHVSRSASFNIDCIRDVKERERYKRALKPNSVCEATISSESSVESFPTSKLNDNMCPIKTNTRTELSVFTIDSDSSTNITKIHNQISKISHKCSSKMRKTKEPNKCRAVTIVMLTSGSVIVTWMPFFFTVIFFVFCEDKLVNPRCLYIRSLLSGPLVTLALLNSILNPLIYAWWHKGFKKFVRGFYKKYFKKLFLISS